jgi:hypothetical protein
MKTSELTGIALDWAVAKAEVIPSIDCEVLDGSLWYGRFTSGLKMYCPSIDWAQGGAIIERERITLVAMPDGSWQAKGRDLYPHFHNPTPLIAAMRCYVAAKLGDEVEVPDNVKG